MSTAKLFIGNIQHIPNLNFAQKSVLQHIYELTKKTGFAFIRNDVFAKRVGVSKDCIKRNLTALEQLNYIRREVEKRRYRKIFLTDITYNILSDKDYTRTDKNTENLKKYKRPVYNKKIDEVTNVTTMRSPLSPQRGDNCHHYEVTDVTSIISTVKPQNEPVNLETEVLKPGTSSTPTFENASAFSTSANADGSDRSNDIDTYSIFKSQGYPVNSMSSSDYFQAFPKVVGPAPYNIIHLAFQKFDKERLQKII